MCFVRCGEEEGGGEQEGRLVSNTRGQRALLQKSEQSALVGPWGPYLGTVALLQGPPTLYLCWRSGEEGTGTLACF
jgi:hypothetical protein